MTAEEAIAAIAEEMKSQAEVEKRHRDGNDSRENTLFVRSRSYLKISHIVEKVTGTPTGVLKDPY